MSLLLFLLFILIQLSSSFMRPRFSTFRYSVRLFDANVSEIVPKLTKELDNIEQKLAVQDSLDSEPNEELIVRRREIKVILGKTCLLV